MDIDMESETITTIVHEPNDGGGVVDKHDHDFDDSTNQSERLTNDVEEEPTSTDTDTKTIVDETHTKQENEEVLKDIEQASVIDTKQEVKEDDQQIKEDVKTSEETSVKDKPDKIKSRELKSLIAAAKESNLDTNIVHKRKSIQDNTDGGTSGATSSPSTLGTSTGNNTTPTSHIKRNMRSQNPEFVAKHHKFITKCITNDNIEDERESNSISDDKTSLKRKRDSISSTNTSISGGSGSGSPMTDDKKQPSKKLLKLDSNVQLIKSGQDIYCWQCHKDAIQIQCVACVRSYHLRCLRHAMPICENWTCSECMLCLEAENVESRSLARQRLNDQQFQQVLKFALKRMINVSGAEPFKNAVDSNELNDYYQYVVHPMDLNQLKYNIDQFKYKSTQSFIADTKWILHNSMIYNSSQSKLTSIAKSIVKTCKIEMAEIETCPECYINANTHKDTWFIEVCSKPHILVWAKLKGFPFWPAKAVNTNDTTGMVDVRFFGQHDKAWVPIKDVYLYSIKDPNTLNKHQKNNIVESLKEVELHIDKLKKRFGTFVPATVRTPFEPNNELQQLKMLLPNYQQSLPLININRQPQIKLNKKIFNNNYNKNKNQNNANSSVGYGTEDDEVDDEDNDNDNNSDNNDDDGDDDKEQDQDSDNSSTTKTYARSKIERTPVRNSNASSRNSSTGAAATFDKPNTSFSQVTNTIASSSARKRRRSSIKRRDSDVSSTKSYKSDTSSVDHLKINKIESFNEMTEIKLTGVAVPASTTTINKTTTPPIDKITSPIKITKPIIQVNPIELINTNTEIQILTSTTVQNNIDNTDKDDKQQEELLVNKTIINNKQQQYVNKNKTSELKKHLSKNKDDDTNHSVNNDAEADNDNDDDDDSQSLNIDEQLPEQEKDSDYEPDDTDDTDDDEIEDDEDDADNIIKDKSVEKVKDTNKLSIPPKPTTDGTKVTLVDVKKIILGNENKNDNNKNIDTSTTLTKTTTLTPSATLTTTATLSSTTITTTNILNKITDDKDKVINNKIPNVEDKQQEPEKPQQNNNKQVIPPNIIINNKQQIDEQLDPNIDIKEEVLDDTDDDDDTTSTIVNNDKQQQLLPTLNLSPNVTVSKIKKNKTVTPIAPVVNDNISNKFNKLKKFNNYVLVDENSKIKTKPLIQLQQSNNTTTKLTNNDDNIIKTIENVVKGCGNLVKTQQDVQSTVPQIPKRTAELKVISVAEINKKRPTINISSPSSSTTIQPATTGTVTMPITSTNMNVKQKARKSFPNKNHVQHITLNTTATTKRINTTNNNNNNKMMMMMTTATNKTSTSDKDKMVYIPSSSCNSTLSLSSLTSSTATTTTPSVTILQQPQQQQNTTFNTTKFIVPQNIFTSLQQTHSNGGGIALVSTGSGGQTKTTPIQQIIPIQHATTTSTTVLNDEVQRNTNDGLPPLRPRPGTSTSSGNNNTIKLIGPLNTILNDTTSSAAAIPSSAGPVAQLLNKSSQQMSDYFRSIIIETLSDLSSIGCLEAKIKQLQMELEQQKHKHYEEITSLKYEIAALKQTHLSEKQRIVHETRQACEQDRIRAVDEAKSKQWCAMCLKESQYRCCWSTSYCSYVCQRNHWPTHQTKCQQNVEKIINNNTTTTTLTTNTNTTSTIDNNNETIIKTVKNNSYNATNNIKNKQHQLTNKNVVNKANTNKLNLVTSSKSNGPTPTSSSPSPSSVSGNGNNSGVVVGNGNNSNSVPTLTFVQNSSGGIELVNHGPIALGGKLIPTSQFTSKIKGYLVSTNALAQQQQQVINTTTSTQAATSSTTSTTSNDKDVENMIID